MGISSDRQFAAFLYAILTGVLCGAVYDGVRISRVLFGIAGYTRAGKRLYGRALPLIGAVQPVVLVGKRRTGRLILLFVGDLCFAGLSACAFSVFLYHAASGCFRWFYLLGCGIGFFLYYQTVGRIVMLSSEALVFCCKAVIRYLCWLLFAPLRGAWWLLRRLGALIRARAFRPICRRVRRRCLLRYTRRVRQNLAQSIRVTLTDPP